MLLKDKITSMTLLTYGVSECLLKAKSSFTRINIDLALGNIIFSLVVYQREYYPPSADGNQCFTRDFTDSLGSMNNRKEQGKKNQF